MKNLLEFLQTKHVTDLLLKTKLKKAFDSLSPYIVNDSGRIRIFNRKIYFDSKKGNEYLSWFSVYLYLIANGGQALIDNVFDYLHSDDANINSAYKFKYSNKDNFINFAQTLEKNGLLTISGDKLIATDPTSF